VVVNGQAALVTENVYPVELGSQIGAEVTSVYVDAKHKFPTREQLVPRLKYMMAELTPTFCWFIPAGEDGNGVAQALAELLFVVAFKDADELPIPTAMHAIRAVLESEDGRIMLRRIAGRPTPLPTETTVAVADPAFRFIDERTIEWRGKTYILTPSQRNIINALYQAYEVDLPEVYYKVLLKALKKKSGEIRYLFQGRNKELFHHPELDPSGCLILKGAGKRTLRLNLPAKPIVH
jgi:hypothetical protein